MTGVMARKGGWTRVGSRRHFRYLDARGRRITDPGKLARIEALAIPPAWKDVWISPRPSAKLQATGTDAAGRRQYRYHDDYRAAQEQAKFDKLIRFADALPTLREAMSEHMEHEPMTPEWTCALAVRLINLGWFRVGDDRYTNAHKTFGITTLRKGHVKVRGSRIAFRFRAKHRVMVHTAVVDSAVAAMMRTVGERLGNTPAVARASYVSPAVVDQYLDGRTIDDFRPRHLRVVRARETGLDLEEQALVSLLRSWRIRSARKAA